jgi:hypothetical protein
MRACTLKGEREVEKEQMREREKREREKDYQRILL